MKKTISILLTVFILTMTSIPTVIHAEEIIEVSGSNFQIVSESSSSKNGIEYREMIFSEEGNIYITEIYEHEIFVYDENRNLLASATYGCSTIVVSSQFISIETRPAFSLMSLVDDYDIWNGWRPTTMVNFVPNFSGTNIVKGVLKSLIVAALTGNGIVISIIAVEQLVNVIWDGIENGTTVYVKGDYDYNSFCSILRKERVNRYNSNGTIKTYGATTVNWLDTPWIYDLYPAACRTLTQRY